MTLFEYLTVLLSIVLSFGVIRLLDGLPAAFRRERRDPLHTTWVINVLLLHVQYWWAFWSYSAGVEWNYPSFILALGSPLLLYSLAITLVPREPEQVESWRDHFARVRRRFFHLFAAWILALGLANWLVLGQPFINGLRIGQAAFILLFLAGAAFRQRWLHWLLVALSVVLLVVFAASTFFQPAPLSS